MNKIVRVKGGFDFQKGLEKARRNAAYYEEDMLLDVAGRVIDVMESKNITRTKLAQRLSVSPAYITKILQGHANMTIETLAKVAFALDLKWECILIHKNAKIGIFSLSFEKSTAQTRSMETATVQTGGAETAPDVADEYSENVDEVRYNKNVEEGGYELSIPA